MISKKIIHSKKNMLHRKSFHFSKNLPIYPEKMKNLLEKEKNHNHVKTSKIFKPANFC